MKVLVTGHRGYIGSVLCQVLMNRGIEVVGLDVDYYRGCAFGRVPEFGSSLCIDIRAIELHHFDGVDAVIHLAGIADDASGDLDPQLTEDINFAGTMRMAEVAKVAGVERFFLASSCSVYGKGALEPLTEKSLVHPLTTYARSKLSCEQTLSALADEYFSPVYLRLGTVYGVSPKLRLDTVVNDFVGAATTTQRITMRTAGLAWRPLIHVEDVARTITGLLSLSSHRIHNRAINIVQRRENYRITQIADAVTDAMPECRWTGAFDVVDTASYSVCGELLAHLLPGFRFHWKLEDGIRQLAAALQGAGVTSAEWRSDRYRRVMRLRSLLERGELDLHVHHCAHDMCVS